MLADAWFIHLLGILEIDSQPCKILLERILVGKYKRKEKPCILKILVSRLSYVLLHLTICLFSLSWKVLNLPLMLL